MKHSHRPTLLMCSLVLALACARSGLAHADEPELAPPEDPIKVQAREEFLKGAELVHLTRWGDALVAFERASKLKPHAITTYNIAQCQRATGQYMLARQALLLALEQDRNAGGAELPESARTEARGLVAETTHILPRIHVRLAPDDAAVAVDGRPLERTTDDAGNVVLIAGTRSPAPGEPPKVAAFDMLANPGAHVFTVSRAGYQDVVVNRTFAPGGETSLSLELDRLPATIHVTSNVKEAVVRVDDMDVGNPPVDVSRNGGRYRVRVTRTGYVPFDTEVAASPGQHVELPATLREDKKTLTQQWWFWTAAGALVIGAATTTYFLTRPDPSRPAPDTGGLGWALKVP